MSNGNPFDEGITEDVEEVTGRDPTEGLDQPPQTVPLSQRAAPLTEEDEEEDGNPFDQNLFEPGEEDFRAPTKFSVGGALTQGFKEGALGPLTIFGVDVEEETDRPIAEAIGKLGGIGVSVVPFFGGTRMALKGLGLANSVRAGRGIQVAGSETLGLATEGAIGGALFEAGFAEEPSEIPERAAIGAGLGLTFDPIAGKFLNRVFGEAAVASRTQARMSQREEQIRRALTEEGEVRTIGNLQDVQMPATPLKQERAVRPENLENIEEVGFTVNKLAGAPNALDETVAQTAAAFRPGGASIVHSRFNPGDVVPRLRESLPESASVTPRRLEDGSFEYLVADDGGLRTEILTKIDQMDLRTSTQRKIERRFREGAEGEALTFDEMAELFGEVTDINRIEAGQFETPDGSLAYGSYNFRPPPENSRINVATESGFKSYTLVHEFVHHHEATVGLELSGVLPEEAGFSEMLRYVAGIPEGRRSPAASRILDELAEGDLNINEIRAEMEDLSKIRVMRRWKNQGVDFDDPIGEVESLFQNQPGYWRSDREMMARVVEMMVADPDVAREVAPRATEIMAESIAQNRPRLDRVLPTDQKFLAKMVADEWEKVGERRIFTRIPLTVTRSRRQQFRESGKGVFEGMEVIGPDGKPWRYVRQVDETRLTQTGSGKPKKEPLHRLQNPLDPDESILVTGREFSRPTIPRLLARNRQHMEGVRRVLDDGPDNWVGVALRHPESRNVLQGFIDISRFERVNMDELAGWIRRNRTETRTGLTGTRPQSTPINREEVFRIVQARDDLDGVLLDDEGVFTAVMDDPESVISTRPFATAEDATGAVDGQLGDNIIQLSFDNVTRGMLRQAGVPERELQHFVDIAREQYGRRLRNLMDDEFREMLETAERNFEAGSVDVRRIARMAGFDAEQTNGRWRLYSFNNRQEAVKGFTESDAVAYAMESGPASSQKHLKDTQIPDGTLSPHAATSTAPPRPYEQAGGQTAEDLLENDTGLFGGLFQGTQVTLSMLTARENVFQRLEELGLGPLWSEIFQPTQRAILRVDRIKANEVRQAFDGLTWKEELEGIADLTSKLSGDRRTTVVDWIEFMTKGEVAERVTIGEAGRGMTTQELRVANRIDNLGVAEEVPRLHAVNRLVENLLESKSNFDAVAEQVARRETTETMDNTLRRLREIAEDTPDSREEILERLGLSAEEREVVDLIEQFRGSDPNDFSLFAVGRHARAPELPENFSSGKEWFAEINDMTETELQLAQRLQRFLDEAFQRSNLDAERQLAGYWPHMRKYAQHGFSPEDDFIQFGLPESYSWSAQRFRTGELDIYNRDPAATAGKYLHGLLMKEEFDPAYRQAVDALRNKVDSERATRLASEYLDDLLGRPHSSFQKLDNAIGQAMEKLGVEMPEDFSRNIVNTFLTLSYGATIPFRPALIARNYFQGMQNIAPFTGVKDYLAGARRAMSDEGFEQARAAGVLEEFVAPVESATEISETFADLGVNQRMKDIVRRGFDWYKSADDFNRAAAYHAMRRRINRAQTKLQKGEINFDEFLGEAKIKTFSDPEQQRFIDLWTSGDRNSAIEFAGQQMSRRSIFRYGHANHPHGWNSVQGRLFGQFGTWPVQYKDMLIEGLTQGRTKDKIEFAATHLATNMGIVTAGSAVGMNLWNWVTFPSLQYTGGPGAEIMINLAQFVSGSESERALAERSLKFQFPSLDDPRTIFIPGSYAIGDYVRGFQEGGAEGLALMGGFDVKEPDDVMPHEWIAQQF